MTLLEDIARGIALSALMNRAERGDFNIDEAVNEFWPTYEPDARAALAAIEASGTHVVVPTEATREMLYEFNIHRADSLDQYGWNDIISARPKVT